MKNRLYLYLTIFCIFGLNMSLALAATGTSDTQIIDLENKDAQDLNVNFKLQKFNSCENLENVMLDYLKDYSEIYPWYLRWAPEMLYDKWISPRSISSCKWCCTRLFTDKYSSGLSWWVRYH